MPLPWMQRRPASMTSHFELSIMIGTRAISGSPAIRFRKRTIAALLSSIASSMLMSMTCAPFSTCWRATPSASSNWPFRIRRANAFEPVTLVRSPMLTNSASAADHDRLEAGQLHRGNGNGIVAAIARSEGGPRHPPRPRSGSGERSCGRRRDRHRARAWQPSRTSGSGLSQRSSGRSKLYESARMRAGGLADRSRSRRAVPRDADYRQAASSSPNSAPRCPQRGA